MTCRTAINNALSDRTLTERCAAAYQRVMLLEVNGAQYSTHAGREQMRQARAEYERLLAEKARRIPSVNHLTQEVSDA